jgi:hypothetical protein
MPETLNDATLRTLAAVLPHKVTCVQLRRALGHVNTLLDDLLPIILIVGHKQAKGPLGDMGESWMVAAAASATCSTWANICAAWRAEVEHLCLFYTTDDELWFVSRHCPRLQHLSLLSEVHPNEWHENMERQDGSHPQDTNQPTDFGLQAVARGCSSLQELCLENCHNITSRLWSSLGALQLVSLQINSCYQFSDCGSNHHGTIGIALQDAVTPSLRTLHLSGCSIDAYGVAAACMARCPKLQELNFEYADMHQGDLAQILRVCRDLQRLRINDYVHEGIVAMTTHCQKLTTLELPLWLSSEMPTAAEWAALGHGCPVLANLLVEACVLEHSVAFIAQLPALQRLFIEAFAPGFDDAPPMKLPCEADVWMALASSPRLHTLIAPFECISTGTVRLLLTQQRRLSVQTQLPRTGGLSLGEVRQAREEMYLLASMFPRRYILGKANFSDNHVDGVKWCAV